MDNQRKYTPSYFVAMFCPQKSFNGTKANREDFVHVAKGEPDITFTTESFSVFIRVSPSAKVAVDRENQVTLILHGEIVAK